jgi:hypothetical protein
MALIRGGSRSEMILAAQWKRTSCTVNVRYHNATLAKARESPFFKNPKQSAAIVALAADYKLLLDLAGSFVYGANCNAC